MEWNGIEWNGMEWNRLYPFSNFARKIGINQRRAYIIIVETSFHSSI